MNMHRYFSIWSFLIMLILTLFLVMLSAKRNQKGNDKVMLRPLSVEDVFENGSLFEDISEPLISRLENRMAIIAVPNFREIEVADQSIKTGVESDECVILLQTIFYKGIMPSEKVLDFPVDCNTLTGSVNL